MFIKKILDGQVYGDLTVIKRLSETNSRHSYFLVKCKCGTEISVRSDNLKNKKDCGCGKLTRLIGKRYGNGIVVKFASKKNNGSKWELVCDCGNSYITSKTMLENGTIRSCGCKKNNRILDSSLIGTKIGSLEIIKFTSNCRHKKILCKCDCGNIIEIVKNKLKHMRSCGCLIYNKGNHHPNYKGYKGLSLRYYNRYKNNAEKRGLLFNLSIQFLWDLFVKQNKRCAITNIPIILGESKKDESTASLDRIDSSKNYTEDNVQWVHKDINQMKSNHSEEYFLFLCKKVIDNVAN